MFKDIFQADWVKLRRSVVWLIALGIPLFLSVVGIRNYTEHFDVFREEGITGWMGAWTQVEFLYGMLLCPVLVGVYVSLLCHFEHLGGGWKQMLSFPVSRSGVYFSKMLWAWLLVGITNFLVLALFLLIGNMFDVEGSIPWAAFLMMIFKGWLSSLTLVAVLLWVSTRWSHFGLPIALNFCFCITQCYYFPH
ncbi:ABC transporter permease [Paenactinomyces guangxiensis]|uniref:ABC transporter permease n=1 Tax=Paenactinomyces guangxiensis TaxID=1490290 RepID=A0A7W1WPM1_9BACL|nr:ABC transporter permease [Paenactinomyces guangxiensis]MBA4493604.1 ABC transporter permease [Paenactinomyces guangxiensis]MBH8590891.1 ABC transporter permease [Paenactinomyces guangxiensis]